MEFRSITEILKYFYSLDLNKTSYRFRGQANFDWNLKPSIYRYCNFKRYQTVDYESNLLQMKPKAPSPPLTFTTYDLEWLMLCQHYGIPTRLMDWSFDILSALFFACNGEPEIDGALFICNHNDYPNFAAYEDRIMDTQELVFVNTSIINPRLRAQSGCFMLWGHAPLDREESKESYDLWEYQKKNQSDFFIQKIKIPSKNKEGILKELKNIYSIDEDNIYLKNGFLESKFLNSFIQLKESARLMTLYKTDADRLSKKEEKIAKSFFRIDCRNMFGNCYNISKM